MSREAKKWYKYLPIGSIQNFASFQTAFFDGWDDKQSPLQVMSEYNNIKKGGFESVHEFSSRFMRVYNSIPTDIKPLVGVVKLHYAEAFDNDFALLLRERKYVSLPIMFIDSLEVEANMMACGKIKQKVDVDRRKVDNKLFPPLLLLLCLTISNLK